MKRKTIAVFLMMSMALGLTACGGSSDSASDEASKSSSSSGDTIRMVNGKIEIDAQMKELAEKYKEETGVTVEIESIGGGVDIQSTLKGYYQGDNMPDIFVCGSDSDFGNWEGMLVDMSDEAWASDTESAYISVDGTVGFPYTTEAIGLAYNADILEKAGIDPATLTGPDAIADAFATIDSKKEELGLTAVVGYCAEPTDLWWSTGNHMFGVYLDSGLDREDTTYIDLLNDGGQVDVERMTDFAAMVGMFNQYSDPALLVSGTYDQQILNFASGKYAFVTQGSWIGSTMTTDDADAYAEAGNFKVGMIPYAFEDGMDTILTSSPSWWAVYKDGNVDAAKAFLQWCAEDEAQKVLVEEVGFVSPFKSCEYVAPDPFAATMVDYISAGKTSSWHWQSMKEGLPQNYLGQVFCDYAAGSLDQQGFVDSIQQVIKACYEN